MVLAFSEADANTYGALNWQDADGNLYAAASWEASEQWIDLVQAPLVRPEWDADEIIDMEAAERAQATLVYWTPDGETETTPASPAALTAIGGVNGLDALAAMGLTITATDDLD
jgi:hypothetical protein